MYWLQITVKLALTEDPLIWDIKSCEIRRKGFTKKHTILEYIKNTYIN